MSGTTDFDEFYRQWMGFCLSTVRLEAARGVGDSGPEDLAQDVMLKIWKAVRLGSIRKPKALIRKVVREVVTDARRLAARRPPIAFSPVLPEAAAEAASPAVDQFDSLTNTLRIATDGSLEETQRSMQDFLTYLANGSSPQTAGRILGKSQAAITMSVRRVLDKLKERVASTAATSYGACKEAWRDFLLRPGADSERRFRELNQDPLLTAEGRDPVLTSIVTSLGVVHCMHEAMIESWDDPVLDYCRLQSMALATIGSCRKAIARCATLRSSNAENQRQCEEQAKYLEARALVLFLAPTGNESELSWAVAGYEKLRAVVLGHPAPPEWFMEKLFPSESHGATP